MQFFGGGIWVSDPWTGPVVFVSRFRAFWWYLCVRNTDLEPNRAKIDFGAPLLKYARILLGNQNGAKYVELLTLFEPILGPTFDKIT